MVQQRLVEPRALVGVTLQILPAGEDQDERPGPVRPHLRHECIEGGCGDGEGFGVDVVSSVADDGLDLLLDLIQGQLHQPD